MNYGNSKAEITTQGNQIPGYGDMNLKDNNKWRLSYTGSALVISSGLVFYADKKPKGLSFDNMMQLIKEHPRESYYEKRIKRRVTLGEALANGKFHELGKEVDMVSSIDLVRIERDREFKKLPASGSQLLKNKYHSKPKELKL